MRLDGSGLLNFDYRHLVSGAANTAFTLDRVGNSAFGSTSPFVTLQVASATPYFAITDTNAGVDSKHWLLSNIDGTFRLGTSSDLLNATSTYFSIAPGGALTVTANSTSTFSSGLQADWLSAQLSYSLGPSA
jgi:hypothetical protein